MTNVELSRDTALRFLQTVVVVDDHAYTPTEDVAEVATLGDESIDAGHEPVTAPDAPLAPDPQDFDTEVVVEAFADLGINCAVLAPDPAEYEADMQRIEKLARRSDIIILDWVLNPRDHTGSTPHTADQTSLGFIRKIIQEDRAGGGRMRLICIYTGTADAASILDKINVAMVDEIRGGTTTRSDRDHTIDLGSVRVVVLGKERPMKVATIESITAKDLPDRAVDEFARFIATGMLREIALDSLSAVRDQSHRLLRRFDGELDPALISHRSTTSPADAEQFARYLVGSELGTIVLTTNVVTAMKDDRVEDYIEDALAGRTTAYYWKSPERLKPSELTVDIAKKALRLGIDQNDKIKETTTTLARKVSRTPLLLPGNGDFLRAAANRIDSRFSMLSSLARDPEFEGEGSPPPVMQLGAVISALPLDAPADTSQTFEADDVAEKIRHWICLQPLCDAVRLADSTRFPILPLKQGGTNFNYVVAHDGEHITLEHVSLKISEMELVYFAPDPEMKVVRAKWEDNRWVFRSETGGTYIWKGSLRLDKAHKLLQSVVTVAGRIGIDEYEYLRGAARPN